MGEYFIPYSTMCLYLNNFIMQVGNGTGSPYKHPDLTAGYICKWIGGAKAHYNLTIDYVGVRKNSKCV